MLNLAMCFLCVMGISMWQNPKRYRFLWKGHYDMERLDEEIKRWGLRLIALVFLYVLYLAVTLLALWNTK